MPFSTFVAHFTTNQNHAPHAVMRQIRREAIARVSERMQAGRAEGAIDFSDLINRIETAMQGR